MEATDNKQVNPHIVYQMVINMMKKNEAGEKGRKRQGKGCVCVCAHMHVHVPWFRKVFHIRICSGVSFIVKRFMRPMALKMHSDSTNWIL